MEKLSIKGMIESIISDIARNELIENYALKLKVIAHHLKNENFSVWLKKELEGYDLSDNVPECRNIVTEIRANIFIDNGFKNATLTDHVMPLIYLGADLARKMTEVKIVQPVTGLESLSREENLHFTVSEYERYKLSEIYKNSTILKAYKPISKTACENIVLKFKSTLLEIFMEFNDTLFNDELDFDLMTKKKEIDNVVSHTINAGVYMTGNATAEIKDTQIVVGDDNNIQINSTIKKELENIVDQIEILSNEVEDDREDVAIEVAKIRTELMNISQRPKLLKSAFNSLKGIAQGVTIEVVKDKIIPLVNKGLAVIKGF